MTLEDPKTHLPPALRDSKLPWQPLFDDQAPCPRCGDSWTAHLGLLRFDLHVDWDSWRRQDGPSNEPPAWQLRLVNTHLDRETSSWELPSLETAAHVARSVHQLLLQELVTEARHALPHAA